MSVERPRGRGERGAGQSLKNQIIQKYLMSQTSVTIRVGKRYALYIPRRIAKALGIEEGDLIAMEVRDGEIRLRPMKKPKLGEYWAEVGPEEVEKVGEELSRGALG